MTSGESMRRFLHIARWRLALAGRLLAEASRALWRLALRHWPRVLDLFVILALAVATWWLWQAPPPRPLVDEPGLVTEIVTVKDVDDSRIMTHGRVEFGTQEPTVVRATGEEAVAFNELRAQLELDKKFVPGDTALAVVHGGEGDSEDGIPVTLEARDHWRLGWLTALFGTFALILLVFGGFTGLRALFTFFFSCLAIWKLMIPYALAGNSASVAAFVTVLVLTAAIIFLVAGISRKGLSAFLGSMGGVATSLILASFAARVLNINGATMPFAQQLLYSGAPNVDLQDIFVGAMILASSGAVMDLAMDIAAGIEEVSRHNPTLGFRKLLGSGIRIGRSVVGTMTTTLLLAYSGGYLTLLMVFAAEGKPPSVFLNTPLVAAEVVKTMVGSLGLVLVAPLTALVSAFVFKPMKGYKS